jgi:DsbC/DsbD-like thiol-disulfide interchange protein
MNPGRALIPALTVVAAACLTTGPASAQQAPRQPVTWSAALSAGTPALRAGGRFVVAVTAKIDDRWHVYGVEEVANGPRPLRIVLPSGQPFTAGTLEAPDPIRELDPAFNQVTTHYAQTATFRLPVTIARETPGGAQALALEVSFQACDGRICLPGRKVKLSVRVPIEAGPREP